ncbi:MAG: E3 binding domain-containing protein, partial [Gammaproteobacteria bacterium]|nr:E3 binding domain-containing protein [Gammaproteobacteria bacterium]
MIQDILIPDVGGATDVDVIEILVTPGQQVTADDALITLESDKASMDVPSPYSGIIKAINIAVGDKVNEGDVIVSMEVADDSSTAEPASSAAQTISQRIIKVPDVGAAHDVEVIEVNVAMGDTIIEDEALITLESDKASMDVPSTCGGKFIAIHVAVGDKVNEGSDMVTLETTAQAASTTSIANMPAPSTLTKQVAAPTGQSAALSQRDQFIAQVNNNGAIYAGPAVRRIAQEFGVNLTKIKGTGRKGRITKKDVQAFVKQALIHAEQGGGLSLGVEPAPEIDFSKFGTVETKSLNKI